MIVLWRVLLGEGPHMSTVCHRACEGLSEAASLWLPLATETPADSAALPSLTISDLRPLWLCCEKSPGAAVLPSGSEQRALLICFFLVWDLRLQSHFRKLNRNVCVCAVGAETHCPPPAGRLSYLSLESCAKKINKVQQNKNVSITYTIIEQVQSCSIFLILCWFSWPLYRFILFIA